MIASNSFKFDNHTQTGRNCNLKLNCLGFLRRQAVNLTVALLSFGGLVGAVSANPVQKAAVGKSEIKGDPLHGDVWHAINGTWPGTIVFDGKTKKVVLTPVGAQAIQAAYKVEKLKKTGSSTSGELLMKSADGLQTVTAMFTLRDRNNMSLRYLEGQREETYIRMTPAEEEIEKARLLKLIEEKKLATQKMDIRK